MYSTYVLCFCVCGSSVYPASYKCVFAKFDFLTWALSSTATCATSVVRKNAFDLIFTKCQLDVTSSSSEWVSECVAEEGVQRGKAESGRRHCRRLCCADSAAWFIVLMKLRVNNLVAGWRPKPRKLLPPRIHPWCALSWWTFERLYLRLNMAMFHAQQVAIVLNSTVVSANWWNISFTMDIHSS